MQPKSQAEVAQLVEHNLAKVGVASPSLVFRSKARSSVIWLSFFVLPDTTSPLQVLMTNNPHWMLKGRLLDRYVFIGNNFSYDSVVSSCSFSDANSWSSFFSISSNFAFTSSLLSLTMASTKTELRKLMPIIPPKMSSRQK